MFIRSRIYKNGHKEPGRKMAEAVPFVCKDCGHIFVMDKKEMDWYTQKMGWPLPGRCKECRKKRREAKKA